MSAFWAYAAVLTAAVLGITLWPLLRGRHGAAADRAAYDIQVYKDQLGEIDNDLDRGLLDADQAEGARVEIQRRMLNVVPETTLGDAKPNPLLAGILTVLVAGGAIGVYLHLGQPGTDDLPLASRDIDSERTAWNDIEIDSLVARLAERLERNPKDLDGWVMLGRSYNAVGRYQEAAEVFAKAVDLGERLPELLGFLAEALVMAGSGETLPDAAKPILEELRSKDAADPRPYFYLGLDKAGRGDMKGALQEWVNLVTVSSPDVPWYKDITHRIKVAEKELGLEPGAVAPTVTPPRAATPGPTPEDVEAAAGMEEEERQAVIRSMVERLATRLEENPDDREGWLRLAGAYEVLGETLKAASARARAEALGN